MGWIIDVNVGAWSRIRRLRFLITGSVVTATKGSMNGLLSDNFVLDVILLLLVIVLTWSRCLGESLSRVRGLALVLPKFSPLRLSEERLWLLTDELAIRVLLQVLLRGLLD